MVWQTHTENTSGSVITAYVHDAPTAVISRIAVHHFHFGMVQIQVETNFLPHTYRINGETASHIASPMLGNDGQIKLVFSIIPSGINIHYITDFLQSLKTIDSMVEPLIPDILHLIENPPVLLSRATVDVNLLETRSEGDASNYQDDGPENNFFDQSPLSHSPEMRMRETDDHGLNHIKRGRDDDAVDDDTIDDDGANEAAASSKRTRYNDAGAAIPAPTAAEINADNSNAWRPYADFSQDSTIFFLYHSNHDAPISSITIISENTEHCTINLEASSPAYYQQLIRIIMQAGLPDPSYYTLSIRPTRVNIIGCDFQLILYILRAVAMHLQRDVEVAAFLISRHYNIQPDPNYTLPFSISCQPAINNDADNSPLYDVITYHNDAPNTPIKSITIEFPEPGPYTIYIHVSDMGYFNQLDNKIEHTEYRKPFCHSVQRQNMFLGYMVAKTDILNFLARVSSLDPMVHFLVMEIASMFDKASKIEQAASTHMQAQAPMDAAPPPHMHVFPS